jgi:hypothetical protein
MPDPWPRPMRVRFGRLPAVGLSAPSFKSVRSGCTIAAGLTLVDGFASVAAVFAVVFAAGFRAGAFRAVDFLVVDFFSAIALRYAA